MARQIFMTIAYLIVMAVLLWNILRLYPGDRWLPVRMGSYFTPWLLLAAVLVLPAAWLTRRRWLIAAALMAVMLTGSRFSYLIVPPTQSATTQSPASSLSVMSFNVNYANRNAEDIATLILSESPDIVGVQEYTASLQHTLVPLLASEYPYHTSSKTSGFSVALFSRYPITAIETPADIPRALRAIVETPAGPVTIWNIHPGTAINQYGWETQQKFLTEIAGWLSLETGAVIVLGDLNTTNQAENYQLIARHLTDVNKAVGQSFNLTFPDPAIFQLTQRLPWLVRLALAAGPFVGIDHIFVSEHFTPRSFQVIQQSAGSDHRPVVATLTRVE